MSDKRSQRRSTVSATHPDTANDRFKERAAAWFWGGLILATMAHFGFIRLFPALATADVSFAVSEFRTVELPPEVNVPPPPEAIQRPALPVVAETDLDEDVTIAPTTFEENPVDKLPPPPAEASRLADAPAFTPYTVAPRLRDPKRAERIVEKKYPKLLSQAGVGGRVIVWAFIDTRGVVQNCQVHQSSGIAQLDRAAEAAVMEFTFEPALNFDKHVAVWIQMPITFAVAPGG
jgi:TonB family protein